MKILLGVHGFEIVQSSQHDEMATEDDQSED